ncbi:hypothetical protein QE429_004500 [Bacillus sp. SORGH_AS 510]|uniref:DUF4362 domain-containing protein n=1 Tax=Bacillus sp. SORGH_AS_0510 TaxID=3041771 RepID=UPI002780BCFD|nr:DUF4362 domain-containing protein [Bacillus sp. SORGH_AS_0510]MDQ1147673.1 hypothetical protein [Bacillus sp. SORGH_AS_0510]
MSKKALWLGLIAFVFVLLAACQRDDESTQKHYKPTANEVVEAHGGLENIKRLDLFVKNVNSGKKDQVRLTRFTIEGDPIYYDLTYNGSKLKIIEDTREDEFGQGEVKTYHCKSIQKQESSTSTKYIIEECPNLGELLTISHDVDQQDLFEFELKYGVGMKNKINTKEQELIKDLQNGEEVGVSDFQFSKDEMNQIYKLMILSNYLEEKKLSTQCNKKPFESYELTVWINDAKRHFAWSECDKSKDGKQMSELVADIKAILKQNPVYQSFPEVKGSYE